MGASWDGICVVLPRSQIQAEDSCYDHTGSHTTVEEENPSKVNETKTPRIVGLVSCSSKKKSAATSARTLYSSELFRRSKRWAEANCDDWYILSAKHGLLHPDRRIAPYDVSLKSVSGNLARQWSAGVADALKTLVKAGDVVVLLAGANYTKFLLSILRSWQIRLSLPLEGRAIGHRLQWFSDQEARRPVWPHLDSFYGSLQLLAERRGPQRLGNCHGRMEWPKRGIYFFFETKESRLCTCQPRVVRVGTHAVGKGSQSTLWSRLKTHKGVASGGGSHRSSVFRLHVGAALLHSGTSSDACPTWAKAVPQRSSEVESERRHEARVSAVLADMEVLVLGVMDTPSPHSDRAYLERNSIALLSNSGARIDPPSAGWLGFASPRPIIRRTGLWNLQHAEQQYDPRFLEVLAEYVDVAAGNASLPDKSIAPVGWWEASPRSLQQLSLYGGEG